MSSTKPLTPLDHPTLHCALVGKEFDSVTQYRGLQYATIPARFQDSIPNDTLILNSIHNGTYIHSATTFGPSCPQKRGAQAWDLTLTGDDLHLEMEAGQGADEKMDERGCLTVNVSVPKGVERPENGFPVFVWVHGGGLAMGSNAWPQYDLRKFVERSVASGKPVIAVAVNYRVGVLGFLACEELGARGNMGFKDLVLGLRWVRRHIAGFGGDAGNLTAAGESAGGIALSTVLCAETGPEPLFERVVVMSGETTLRKPRGGKWHQEMYEDQLKYLGLDGEKVGKEERVTRLREEDAEELCQKLPLAQHFCGFIDGEWLKKAVTPSALEDGTSEMHKPEWCKELVIGDTVHDGTILKTRILDSPLALSRLHQLCSSHLTPTDTATLLSAYNLPLPPAPMSTTAEQSHALLLLASELRFYLPALLAYQGWRARFSQQEGGEKMAGNTVSRYHFHILNPFPGTFKGLVSHELDVGFLLQNLNHVLVPASKDVAKAMAEHFIGFVYGEGWTREGKVVVFTDEGVKFVEEGEYERVWREGRGEVLRGIGGERLWRLAEGWQGVRSEESEESEEGKEEDGKSRL